MSPALRSRIIDLRRTALAPSHAALSQNAKTVRKIGDYHWNQRVPVNPHGGREIPRAASCATTGPDTARITAPAAAAARTGMARLARITAITPSSMSIADRPYSPAVPPNGPSVDE